MKAIFLERFPIFRSWYINLPILLRVAIDGGEGVGHRLDNKKLFAVGCKSFAKSNLYETKKNGSTVFCYLQIF
jgi:hypothetical protein